LGVEDKALLLGLLITMSYGIEIESPCEMVVLAPARIKGTDCMLRYEEIPRKGSLSGDVVRSRCKGRKVV